MRISSVPRIAIQAAAGAIPSESPSQRWANMVKRLANEYVKIIARATGAKARHNRPNCWDDQKKARTETSVNNQANRTLSKPAGRAREAVRLFRASISASRMRLNVMAAERADTMASII